VITAGDNGFHDRLLGRVLASPRSRDELRATLYALLWHGKRPGSLPLRDDRGLSALRELASAREPDDRLDRLRMARSREEPWGYPELEHLDVALAASLLLLRYGVGCARREFLDRLREPGNTWLFDPYVGQFLPPELAGELRELAAEDPVRYAERVELLTGLDALEWERDATDIETDTR